jgi:hypothetical protein
MNLVWIPGIPALRILRAPGAVYLFHLYYTPVFAPWRRHRENLTPSNIMYPKLMDTYQNAPHDTLRWHVVSNTAIKEAPKAVLRERIRRRVREAFREALKQTGYDWNGKVLMSAERRSDAPKKNLKGTMEIHCRTRAALDCKFDEIVKQAQQAVLTIVRASGQEDAPLESRGRQWWDA